MFFCHLDQVYEARRDTVECKYDQEVGLGIQEFVQEIADGQPNGDGCREHDPDTGIVRQPALLAGDDVSSFFQNWHLSLH